MIDSLESRDSKSMNLRILRSGVIVTGMMACALLGTRAQAAQVSCDNDFGHCEVSNEPVSSAWCSCDNETDGTSGGDEFMDMTEEELLEVCNSMLSACEEVPSESGGTSESGGESGTDSGGESGEDETGTTVAGEDGLEDAAEEAGDVVESAKGCSVGGASQSGALMLLALLGLFRARRCRDNVA